MHKWVNPGAKSEGGKTNNKTNQNTPHQKNPYKTGKEKKALQPENVPDTFSRVDQVHDLR